MRRRQQRPREAAFRGVPIHIRNGSNQRRGRHIPVSRLFEVVLGIQQAAPERADQLSVNRIGRRHPAAHRAHGLLRRQRPADDRRDALESARRHSALSDRPRRRRAGLQHRRPEHADQVHGSHPRRHLSREDHEVERSGAGEDQSWRFPPVERHHRRPSLGRIRHDVCLGRLSGEDLA